MQKEMSGWGQCHCSVPFVHMGAVLSTSRAWSDWGPPGMKRHVQMATARFLFLFFTPNESPKDPNMIQWRSKVNSPSTWGPDPGSSSPTGYWTCRTCLWNADYWRTKVWRTYLLRGRMSRRRTPIRVTFIVLKETRDVKTFQQHFDGVLCAHLHQTPVVWLVQRCRSWCSFLTNVKGGVTRVCRRYKYTVLKTVSQSRRTIPFWCD